MAPLLPDSYTYGYGPLNLIAFTDCVCYDDHHDLPSSKLVK